MASWPGHRWAPGLEAAWAKKKVLAVVGGNPENSQDWVLFICLFVCGPNRLHLGLLLVLCLGITPEGSGGGGKDPI